MTRLRCGSSRRALPPAAIACAILLLALALAAPATAQEEPLEEVLGGFGTSAADVEPGEAAGSEAGAGTVSGRVFDASTGDPLGRVTVILRWPSPADGTDPRQDVRVTGADGGFAFPSVPPGRYSITFIRSGYRNATMTDFAVAPDQVNRADFPLPPATAQSADDVLQLDEFVVEAETAAELVTSLETRLESDQLLNILSDEDFSKFAAGDVAEALERVAGVNIVEGQFAVIRGLEDRYSSTLYNGAVIPSPDPDRQSVQLDLFPSDIVNNLAVTKSFSPEQPGNSSGGSIDILTHQYPEDAFEFKIKAGTGFNDNAKERFIELSDENDVDLLMASLERLREDALAELAGQEVPDRVLVTGNPVGIESEKSGSGNFWEELDDVLEEDYALSFGGTQEHGNRQFRFKGVLAREWDYATAEGWQEQREARLPQTVGGGTEFEFLSDLDGDGFVCFCPVEVPIQVTRSGDLALGQLSLTDGRWDVTTSQFERRTTLYGAVGFDLDDEGNHRIDASVFYSRLEEETVRLKENGSLPGFDYLTATQQQMRALLANRPDSPLFADTVTVGSFIARSFREDRFDGPSAAGTLTTSAFFESTSFERDRALKVYQINGDHTFDELPKLHVSWATNWAHTDQEDVAFGLRYFYEPCGTPQVPCPLGVMPFEPLDGSDPLAPSLALAIPASVEALGPGSFVARNNIILSANRIDETSRFSRIDADWETDFSASSTFTLAGGLWWERANRDVESFFVESPDIDLGVDNPACFGLSQEFACTSDTALNLGRTIASSFGPTGTRRTSTQGERDIDAWYVRGKLSLWERLDLLGGVRREDIHITSRNDPFVTDPVTGEPVLRLGGPQTFPTRFLFFDRLDDPGLDGIGSFPDAATVYNDQFLGIASVRPGPCLGGPGNPVPPGRTCVNLVDRAQLEPLVNGVIDERRWLPSAGFTLRPMEGLTLRGGWSKTVARPSFREMGFYVTVEPGSDDLIVGNPQLQLSDVESWDGRIEYTWGPLGDLVALSYFTKDIETPLESILIRDPTIGDRLDQPVFRTFFNNPNTADLWGVEAEFRKSIDFFGRAAPEWLRYLSVGGNFTWIDAEVARTEEELRRAAPFFALFEGDALAPADVAAFSGLEEKRRLFNQPEWIANADVTFDHPDWGTKITVAYFAISDVLDAAGSARLSGLDVLSYTLDRYIDDFYELRATASQTFQLPGSFGAFTFTFAVKNITDSTRRVLYDPEQTVGTFVEREFKVGRDYDVSITYTRTF